MIQLVLILMVVSIANVIPVLSILMVFVTTKTSAPITLMNAGIIQAVTTCLAHTSVYVTPALRDLQMEKKFAKI